MVRSSNFEFENILFSNGHRGGFSMSSRGTDKPALNPNFRGFAFLFAPPRNNKFFIRKSAIATAAER